MTLPKRVATLSLLLVVACVVDDDELARSEQNNTSSGTVLGFHDCSSIGSGSPQTFADSRCDDAFHDFASSIGGGVVTLVGNVGGSFLDGYAADLGQGQLNFNLVPGGTRIVLRLDSAPGRAFPPARSDGDVERYADAVVTWLAHAAGAERVQYIVLGNEPDQYLAEYPAWDDAWNEGVSPDDLGVVTCDFFGTSKRVQYMTPERYARLFVAVFHRLRENGMGQQLVTAPVMPMRFAQWDSDYTAPAGCRDYSIGDYAAAIRAIDGGALGGLGVHLQGAAFPDASDTADMLDATIRDAKTTTVARDIGDGRVRVVPAGSVGNIFNVPVIVKEIHPPPPFWSVDDGTMSAWVRGTANAVREHNRAGRGNRVEAVAFYRWRPNSDVPIGRTNVVVDTIRQLVAEGAAP